MNDFSAAKHEKSKINENKRGKKGKNLKSNFFFSKAKDLKLEEDFDTYIMMDAIRKKKPDVGLGF